MVIRRRTHHGDPEQRESYLAGSMSAGPVNLFERWETQAAVETLRRSAPRNKHGTAMLSVSVAEYDIADVRPLFGKGRA
jgi:hypothetical protein